MKTKTQFMNRILSLVLSIMMVVSMLPMNILTANAAETTESAIDLSTLTGTYVISDSGEYTFTGSGSYGIKVESGNPTIVLNNASIMVGEGSSIDVASGSNATIFVRGDNTIDTDSMWETAGGIFVAEGGTVNITSNGTDNILRAHGTLAAAIGGKYDYDNNESYNAGSISISNVTVYAYTNNFHAAAIGAAGEGTCGTINITNAVVYAYGAGDRWTSAPGIGSAWSLVSWSETIPVVIISDSEVHTFRHNSGSDYIGYLGDVEIPTNATGSINCGEGGSITNSTIYCYTGLDSTTTDKTVKYGTLGGLLKEDGTCEGEHSGGTATCQRGNICDNCGTEYGEPNPNAHTFDESGKCVCGLAFWTVEGNTLTIDGTLGGKEEATEEDVRTLVDQLKAYVDNGITTIIVTGSNPAMIDMGSWTNTAIGEAIYRLSGSDDYDENYPYNGKIDLILQDVTEIVDQEFYSAWALNSITLPKVIKLGDEAFHRTWFLKTITFGSVLAEVNETGGVMFAQVGKEVGGCDLILNCGQMNESSVPTPDLTTNIWRFRFDNEFKSITLTHTGGTATCTEKAVCENCGESYGELGGHTAAPTYAPTADGSEHVATYSCCDAAVTEDHTGGTATCTTLAVCDLCGESYGELGSHSFDSAGTCTGCQIKAKAKLEAFDFELDKYVPTYYATLPEALAAVTQRTSQVEALADYDGVLELTIDFDGNGYTFSGEITVDEYATIQDGNFTGKVILNYGNIWDGTFQGEVIVKADGYIQGGTFHNTVTVETGGKITDMDSTFKGTVINNGSIYAGNFYSNVTNNGKIYRDELDVSVFYGTLTNNGTIYGGYFSGGKLINAGTVENHCSDSYDYEDGFEYVPAEGGTVTGDHNNTTEANCTSGAICSFCGEYGDKNPNNHDFSTIDDNGKCGCGVTFVAAVDKTVYTTFDDAVANWTDGTTLILLDNVTLTSYITVTAENVTLDLNGKSLSGSNLNGVINVDSGSLTIDDSATGGVIENTEGWGVVVTQGANEDNPGMLTIKGGWLKSEATLGVVVETWDYSKVSIGGDAIIGIEEPEYFWCWVLSSEDNTEITVTGGTFLGETIGRYDTSGTLKISGGVFQYGIRTQGGTLNSLLAEGYAYWQDGKMLILDDSVKEINGAVEIKSACTHETGTTTYADNGDGTHSKTYSCCEATVTEEHTLLTYSASGNVITGSCSKCPAVGTATITAENTTYKGTAQETATVAYSEGWNSGELTVSYVNNVNAGTATASITLGEATASVEFTIAKAEVDLDTLVDPEFATGLVYNGTAQALVIKTGSVEGGTILYSLTYDGEYTSTIPVATEAGRYGVYWLIQGDENHEDILSPGWTQVIIAAKPGTDANVTLGEYDSVYSGTAKEPGIASVVVDGVTLTAGKDYDVSYENNVYAGTAKAVITFKGNYSGTVTETFQISKAPLTVTADDKSMTTGRDLPAFTYTITGFVNGETEAVLTTKPTVSCEADGQTAGTYDITVSGAEAANYDITHVNGTLSVVDHQHAWTYTADGDTITAKCGNADTCPDAEQTIKIAAEGKTYDGTPVTATLTGNIDGVDTPAIRYFKNGTELNESVINAGTYTASITLGEATASVEFTIEKATVTVTADAKSKPYGYEDPTLTYTSEGLLGDDVLTGALTREEGENAGSYAITLGTLTAGDNYTISFTGAELTITDGTAPAGTILIKENGWSKFWNTITFGIFCKDYVDVTITADGTGSGVTKVEYLLSDTVLEENNIPVDGWTTLNADNSKYSFSIKAQNKVAVYVRITDEGGNVTVINSDGIVVYEDSEAVDTEVTYTYKENSNKDIAVEFNGNTVNSIVCGEKTLAANTDYSVDYESGKIVLAASYLDTLNAGDYTFTVSYDPMGVENSGVTALTTTFIVKVEPTSIAGATVTVNGTFTYDGNAKTPDPVVVLNGETLVKDRDYTVSYAENVNAGTATVTVTGKGNYSGTASGSFRIERAKLTDISVQQNGKLTYNGEALTPAVTANATALNGAKVYFIYSADGSAYGSMPTFTDAGTYTVYYCAYTVDNNFFDHHDTFTVTIDKATVTEPTIASKPYNGSAQTADVSASDLYTVEKNNGGTEKGSYDVVLKLKDSANYKWSTTKNEEVTLQFVISAAQNAWDTNPSISGWTYGEAAKTPVGTAKYGAIKVAYTGKANDGTDYNSETAPTKAGNYTATFTVTGTEDYSGLSEQVNFTIAKKAVTVTANDASKTYGESDPALTYTHTELVGSDALVITVARASGENANTYTITASQAEGANPNYEITFKTGTFTIRKAPLTVTVENKTATYGDAVPTYTVKYDGFKNGDDKDDLSGALAFDCGYAQFSDKGEYTIKASGYTSGNYTISYVDGKLTVNARPITVTIQNATSVYGDTLAELKATDNGIVNGDANVYSLATTATSTSNVGKYAITGTALDSNYDVTFVNGEYEITKREITITVDAKNTVVNTTLPTYTYKVEGLVGVDTLVTEPTLTCNANIALIGEYDITASGADAGGNYSIKYVPAKLTVLTDNAVDAAAGYTEELKDYDPKAVTSEDKAELDEMLSEINTILADEMTTDNGKKALEEVKEQVEKLIKEITDAAEATDTENTEKVENVTPENVTPENKTDLEGAKADLEKALEDNGGNYTEDEKKAIEEEIKRIDDALEVIGNVEAVEEVISKLPAVDTVKPDDEEAIKAITDAQTAYNALSDYEKSLVDDATKANLDKLAAALVAYDIVEGDGSSWAEDSDHNITFIVNGLFGKFVGIKVDGKDVDKANYEVKAGSTIITLKASYLDTLAVGEHTITVVYTDGSTDGAFNVHAKANSPATGDDFNISLYGSLMVVSVTALVVLLLASKKRKQVK